MELLDYWFRNLAVLLRAKPSSLPPALRIERPEQMGEPEQEKKTVEKDPNVIAKWFSEKLG